jgi:hypothetical protein
MARTVQRFNTLNGVTEGVWRDGSVIIKRLRSRAPEALPAWAPSDSPTDWNYWRREALVYETALPKRLGMRAPDFVELSQTDGGVELRIDAIDGRTASSLTVADLIEASTVLGHSNGRPDQPREAWLSANFLRAYSTSRDVDFALCHDPQMWQQELVALYVDDDLRAGLARLHRNRERLLGIMEALPRAVCHLDIFPNNIIASDAGITFIDWAFVGDGAVGEDIGNLIPDAVFDLQLPLSSLGGLGRVVPAAYLRGLRSSGWDGSDSLVMQAIHASAVKYDWLVPRLLDRARSAATTAPTSSYGGALVSAHELFRARWGALAMLVRWADEAIAVDDRNG